MADPYTYREITEQIFAANALEARGQFMEALESFLVAADLAEETQDDRARRLRGRARRIAVFLAAVRRWPDDVSSIAQIDTVDRQEGEIETFWIWITHHDRDVPRWVRIDRRGHLRVIEGPTT